jgi:hypothetical protein
MAKAYLRAHHMRGKIKELTSKWGGKNAISFEDIQPEEEIFLIRMNFRFQIYKSRITDIEAREHVAYLNQACKNRGMPCIEPATQLALMMS